MKQLLNFAAMILAILLGFFALRLILPMFAPFLLAFTAAAILEPAMQLLTRKSCTRGLAAGLLTALLLCVVGGLIVACTTGGAHILTVYAKKAPLVLSRLGTEMSQVQQKLLILLGHAPAPLARQILGAAENLTAHLEGFPLWASRQLLRLLTALAKSSPDWLLFFCSLLLGIYFFTLYYPDIWAFFRRQIPEPMQGKIGVIWSVTVGAGLSFFKVQLIISAVTFAILLLSFHLMGLTAPVSSAAAVAVVDALPILGSGIILLPWAAVSLLLGQLGTAAGLVCIYGVLLVCHNLLQTKLLGDRLGLHPVTALVSLYVGYRLWGFWGMLGLPIGCVLLTRLNRAGIIHLYR